LCRATIKIGLRLQSFGMGATLSTGEVLMSASKRLGTVNVRLTPRWDMCCVYRDTGMHAHGLML